MKVQELIGKVGLRGAARLQILKANQPATSPSLDGTAQYPKYSPTAEKEEN